MSAEQEVQRILHGSVPDGSVPEQADEVPASVTLAAEVINQLLNASGTTLLTICQTIERSTTRKALQAAFRDLNEYTRVLTETDPHGLHDVLVRDALISLSVSERLEALLGAMSPVSAALVEYKKAVIKDLAISMRRRAAKIRVEEERDAELLSLLPEPTSAISEDEIQAIMGDLPDPAENLEDVLARKRNLTDIVPIHRKPKKAKFPTLTSVAHITENEGIGGSSTGRALMTREKLRAAQHDPKGLIDLVDTSTNALEHAKKLELLKSKGYILHSNRNRSMTEKFNAAEVRLDLGLGGQSISDTLLFGARVLSTPGVLSAKNIKDIENNFVEGNTSWTHQNSYVRMLTAGCVNQAKRIIEKYDEVLYGPAPEKLVKETHQAIIALLRSPEGVAFQSKADNSSKQAGDPEDTFIRMIVEAVSPIIPITLRNRSLDGGYLRTALTLLAAVEILVTQFEDDIRRSGNPAGAVGMAQSMHNDIERATLYGNQELKNIREFTTVLKAQYQTSLGLGKPFPRDSPRGRRRSRGTYNRFADGPEVYSRGRGRGYAWGYTQPTSEAIYGQAQQTHMRGRNHCYSYRAGNCQRGRGCKYLHVDQ